MRQVNPMAKGIKSAQICGQHSFKAGRRGAAVVPHHCKPQQQGADCRELQKWTQAPHLTQGTDPAQEYHKVVLSSILSRAPSSQCLTQEHLLVQRSMCVTEGNNLGYKVLAAEVWEPELGSYPIPLWKPGVVARACNPGATECRQLDSVSLLASQSIQSCKLWVQWQTLPQI